ncbi:contactin-associated protein 1-like [Polyodon spathula]|uniref:contactin-associated protein 1-like n=1 Tax=Polyodon spathula TaxID=7913 RepID=UPI001B7F42C9|nr:contactin-associated protein 1-like [Polyodon spathula]
MQCITLSIICLLALTSQYCSARPCTDQLVAPLYASSFEASSRYNFLYSANLARLHGGSGWSPAPRDRQPWLQINLLHKYRITAIATQGTFNSYDWVNKYTLLYGDRPDAWTTFVQRGGNSTFSGNWNYYQVKKHNLHYAITAKHLRILPVGWNPAGKIGLRLEVYGCFYDSYVMAFDGDDMVAYRFNRNTMKTLKDVIALNFKTVERDGLLLHGEGPQGDYLTLELVDSKMLMHISLGSSTVHDMTGHTSVTLGNLLDDQHWHYVTLRRYGNYVNLTLDGETASIRCKGDFQYLDLDKELYIGGVMKADKPHLPDKQNFRGCMENVFYNGVNIIDLAKNKMPQIRFPHQKKKIYYACQDLLLKPMTFAGINNYLQVPGPFRRNRMSVKFKFRSWDATGLLMFTNFADNLGSLKMALSEGQVNISIAQPGKKPVEFAAGYRLNDGFWHSVDLVARDNFATVIIDEEEGSPLRINNIFTLRTGDRYFFGGCPKPANGTGCVSDLIAFHGCMQQLYIDSEPVDLDFIMQRQLGRYSQLLLGTCGITDRCTPNLCEHEGKCIQSWDDFICNCDNTGYKGEVCHKSVYKESCEAYRLSGKYSSGNYTIDPDGSGPLKPFVVYCNMQEYKAWSVVRHNREYETKVTGTSMERPFVGDVQYYNASWGEVSALANGSEYCEQRIQYNCYKSRLLNTPDGHPYGFWIGRNQERHFYWGGSFPGIQKCGCGIARSCSNARFYCNCDADYRQWSYDKGLLNYVDHLPVTQVVVGDTNRTASEARFTVGPLRCYGDRNTWNTVSFTKTTHIEFPTFRPGTSADISFHFKTTADHGVFVENPGPPYFIRVELNSTTELLFIFSVGDGIINATLKSPTPLNDDQWHFVKAEINVKMARIKVDEQPWVVRRFPSQSYVNLVFSKPLLVGAAEYKMRGFLGCLRGLRMNGVTLNLEGKVNELEGIKYNCSGHCWNTSEVLCRNAGRCVEKYSTYLCDCNETAFDGLYCHKDIGGYFEPGTWLRYSIRSVPITLAAQFANILDPQSFTLGYNQTSEEIVFSFSTTETPAVLLYISSFTNDYIAVVLKHDGSLDLRYRLGLFVNKYTIINRNLADGDPHIVNVTRKEREIRIEVDYMQPIFQSIPLIFDKKFDSPKSLFLGRVLETGVIDPEIQKFNTPGFTGCMSGVKFNNIVPLKAYFRPNQTNPPITIMGELVESNCGAGLAVLPPIPLEIDPWYTGPVFPYIHDDTPSGPVIALIVLLVLLTLFGTLAALYLYLYHYKGSYQTNEPKAVESPSSMKPLTEEAPKKEQNLPKIQEEDRGE